MLDSGKIHLIETHKERLCRIAVGQKKRGDELSGNVVAVQIKEAKKLGTVVPIRPDRDHRKLSIHNCCPTCFCK